MPGLLNLHGGCVLVGEAGILIRGAAGSGKSTLARAILDAAEARGVFAALVADDRVLLEARHGRLVARPHPALAGLVEVRGAGILRERRRAPAAVLRRVVDLGQAPPRLPDATHDVLLEVRLPRIVLAAGPSLALAAPLLVRAALDVSVLAEPIPSEPVPAPAGSVLAAAGGATDAGMP